MAQLSFKKSYTPSMRGTVLLRSSSRKNNPFKKLVKIKKSSRHNNKKKSWIKETLKWFSLIIFE